MNALLARLSSYAWTTTLLIECSGNSPRGHRIAGQDKRLKEILRSMLCCS